MVGELFSCGISLVFFFFFLCDRPCESKRPPKGERKEIDVRLESGKEHAIVDGESGEEEEESGGGGGGGEGMVLVAHALSGQTLRERVFPTASLESGGASTVLPHMGT